MVQLRAVKYRPVGSAALLRQKMMIYGVGIVPFSGIKLIDMLITRVGLA